METISNIKKMSKDNPFSDKMMMKWVTRLLSFQIDGRLNSGYSFSPNQKRCIAPWTQTMVYPNGDIVFCNDNSDYISGNLKAERFSEIWNSKRSRNFRKFIKSNVLPICSRCCGLHYHPFYRSGKSLRTLAH